MPADLITLLWYDSYITPSQTEYYVPTGGDSLAIAAALAAASGANAYGQWRTATEAAPNQGVATPSDVSDAARLIFSTNSGQQARIIIPSPSSSIWLSDGETVDPAKIAGLITAVQTHGANRRGDTIAAYVAGYRTRIPVPPVGLTTGGGR